MWTRNLGVAAFLLMVAATTALPQQQQRRPAQQQPQQGGNRSQQQQGGNRSQQPTASNDGNIDSISADTELVTLEPASIQRFLNNENSVNTLTRCYINRAQCTSKSSLNLMNQIGAISAAGGQCKTCDPASQQKTAQLLTMLIKGLSERYPQQWQHIHPHIRPLVAALQQKTA